MNKFKKFCPKVWVAECEEEYEKAEEYHKGLKKGDN